VSLAQKKKEAMDEASTESGDKKDLKKIMAKTEALETRDQIDQNKATSAGQQYLRAKQKVRETEHNLNIARNEAKSLETSVVSHESVVARLRSVEDDSETKLIQDRGEASEERVELVSDMKEKESDEKRLTDLKSAAGDESRLQMLHTAIKPVAHHLSDIREKVAAQEVALTEARTRKDSLKSQQEDNQEALKAAHRFVDRVESESHQRHDSDNQKLNEAKTRLKNSQDRQTGLKLRVKRLTTQLAAILKTSSAAATAYVSRVRVAAYSTVAQGVDSPDQHGRSLKEGDSMVEELGPSE